MAQNSAFCKAYYAKALRRFPGWKESTENRRKRKQQVDGKEVTIETTELTEDDIVYLHDNYVVTDGIFHDENIIFNNVTDEWKEFCKQTLEFKTPDYNSPDKAADLVSNGDSKGASATT